jgi:hypothetical protein
MSICQELPFDVNGSVSTLANGDLQVTLIADGLVLTDGNISPGLWFYGTSNHATLGFNLDGHGFKASEISVSGSWTDSTSGIVTPITNLTLGSQTYEAFGAFGFNVNCGFACQVGYNNTVTHVDMLKLDIHDSAHPLTLANLIANQNGNLFGFDLWTNQRMGPDGTVGNGWPDGSSTGFSAVQVAPAVPEPSTWAMMLLGFAGLGFVFHRSRHGARVA